jgi:hypothetical protein
MQHGLAIRGDLRYLVWVKKPTTVALVNMVQFVAACGHPSCKPTVRHGPAPGITNEDGVSENSKPKRTVSYIAAQGNTKILELENRCTGNRTVGSNPPLRQQSLIRKGLLGITDFALPFALPLRSRSAPARRRGHIVSPVPRPMPHGFRPSWARCGGRSGHSNRACADRNLTPNSGEGQASDLVYRLRFRRGGKSRRSR